jgi:hypothetical protein
MEFIDLGADVIRTIASHSDAASWVSLLRASKWVKSAIENTQFDVELRHFKTLNTNAANHSWYKSRGCMWCNGTFNQQNWHPTKFHQCKGCLQYGHSRNKCPNIPPSGCEICEGKAHIAISHRCNCCNIRGHDIPTCKIYNDGIIISGNANDYAIGATLTNKTLYTDFALYPNSYQPPVYTMTTRDRYVFQYSVYPNNYQPTGSINVSLSNEFNWHTVNPSVDSNTINTLANNYGNYWHNTTQINGFTQQMRDSYRRG